MNTKVVEARSVGAREAILEAACQEFSRTGFEGTSTRKVGQRAGVGHTHINYYFGDKKGLWRAAAAHFYEGFHERLDRCLELASGLDDRSRFQLILVEIVMAVSENSLHAFFIEGNGGENELSDWLFEHCIGPAEHRVNELIREGQALGVLVDLKPRVIDKILTGFSMANNLPGMEMPEGEEGRKCRKQEAGQLVSLLLK